jgi:DNA-binding LytR/AlgR family response regulator
MSKQFLIIEDDVLISEHLKDIITQEGMSVMNIVSNEAAAFELLSNERPDLAFVDIRLQGNDSGIKIARKLNELNVPFYFITSFSDKQTIKEAVETEPKGYILKPFELDEIIESIHKLLKFLPQKIEIKDAGKTIYLEPEELIFVKSENVYLEIHTVHQKKYVVRKKLKDFIAQEGLENLVQVHRSFAVDLSKVTAKERKSLFIDQYEIPVSKKYIDLVEKHI